MYQFILYFLFIFSKSSFASSAALTISYTEKPPYYYTKDSTPQGFLLEKTVKLFKKSKLNYKLTSMPPMRIIEEIKKAKDSEYHCSIGWFKNLEREKFAQFSQKIHTDKKMILVTNVNKGHFFNQVATFSNLKDYILKQGNSKTLEIGTVNGFSYGLELDKFLNTYPKNAIDQSNQSPYQLLQKIALERVDFGFFDQEEFQFLSNFDKNLNLKLKIFEFPDFPQGQNRYIMCSLNTPKEIINILNKNITVLE